MPTYEYKCEECGHMFDHFQYMSDEPLKTCPECNGLVRRLISSGAGVLFKGSGFYSTDYRSASYQKGASAESSKSSDTSSNNKKSSEK